MYFMTQGLCDPRIHDGEPDSAEILPDVQPRATDVSQDAVERNNVSAPSSMTEENDAEPFPEKNLVAGLGKGDIGEAQNPTKAKLNVKPFRTHADDALAPQYPCFTAPDIEGSGSPSLEFTRPSLQPSLVAESSKVDIADVHVPNIVIFGEAGVGKSSVINLIAGQKRAHISNDALGCTFQYKRYIVTLDGMRCALWDTTGLDEGTEGKVPAKLAERNLSALMRGLAHSGGIHLVIYCVRGARLTKALKRNYDLFYVTVCRKKVPVALVVTGLEHQQGDMETWWSENVAVLQRCGMWFSTHECVTTLDVDDAVIRWRQSDSQRRLRDLIVRYARLRPWKIDASFIPWASSMFRSLLREVSVMGKKTAPRVIIYDGITSRRTQTCLIGDQQLEYELVHVDTPLTPPTSCKFAGVLVFYTSTLLDTGISPEDVAVLRIFYDVAGGKTCPVIVVLRGCNDDEVALRCWDAVASRYRDIHAYPTMDSQAKVDAMIEELCIEHVEVKTSRLWRAYRTVMQCFAAAW